LKIRGRVKHLRRQAPLAALTLLFPIIGSVQQLPVIADTEFGSLSPTKNFGASPTLTVDLAHSVLLSFDLANLSSASFHAASVMPSSSHARFWQ
jgi:hypothetical protein